MSLPLIVLAALVAADDAGKPKPDVTATTEYRAVSPKPTGIIATGINARGDVIGFEWADDPTTPGIVMQVPFFADARHQVTIPPLATYTAVFPAGVSENGLVIGRVSKAVPPGVVVPLRNQAFLWDEARGIRGLGALPDDNSSIASGISRKGDIISGFSIGKDRVRPCVWTPQGDAWVAALLPHAGLLGSQVVAISDDGTRIAAVDATFPALWTRDSAGAWKAEKIGKAGEFTPRAVNNHGTVVGLRDNGDGTMDAVVSPRNGPNITLPKPEGYPRAEAYAINNLGAVVGMIDGPRGSDVGPDAFVFESGKLRILRECGPEFITATAINDQGQVAGVLDKEPEPEPGEPAKADEPKAPPDR